MPKPRRHGAIPVGSNHRHQDRYAGRPRIGDMPFAPTPEREPGVATGANVQAHRYIGRPVLHSERLVTAIEGDHPKAERFAYQGKLILPLMRRHVAARLPATELDKVLEEVSRTSARDVFVPKWRTTVSTRSRYASSLVAIRYEADPTRKYFQKLKGENELVWGMLEEAGVTEHSNFSPSHIRVAETQTKDEARAIGDMVGRLMEPEPLQLGPPQMCEVEQSGNTTSTAT